MNKAARKELYQEYKRIKYWKDLWKDLKIASIPIGCAAIVYFMLS